jgi:DNA polymerase III delta subunit
VSAAWAKHGFALLHGEDPDRRREAVEAWKSVHVDPEWAEFSLITCGDGCPWAEVLNALQETPPFGARRCVLVPAADNLFAKPKELPANLQGWLAKPPEDVALLLVCWTALPASPGKALGVKPWNDWAKAGRVLKVGVLEANDIQPFIESEANKLGLRLQSGVAALLAQRLGGQPALLKRALEVLDLSCEAEAGAEGHGPKDRPKGGAQDVRREDRQVGAAQVDQVTFRLAEQRAFAWSGAWQKGNASEAIQALRLSLEDGDDALQLLGQARREVDRLVRLAQAEAEGLSGSDLTSALGLSPKQAFLLDGYRGVLRKRGPQGAKELLSRVNQCEKDLKGHALSRSETPLLDLTLTLARAWGR